MLITEQSRLNFPSRAAHWSSPCRADNPTLAQPLHAKTFWQHSTTAARPEKIAFQRFRQVQPQSLRESAVDFAASATGSSTSSNASSFSAAPPCETR